MNGKEALERLLKYVNINEAELITKYGYSASNDIEPIKQDLDRLEKLEKDYEKLKERYKHRVETSNDLCDAVEQYEKAIEILKDRFDINGVVKYDDFYAIECDYTYFYITQEQYTLIKEVLGNE